MMGTDVLVGVPLTGLSLVFLELIFGFKAPEMDGLEVVNGVIDEKYYRNGS